MSAERAIGIIRLLELPAHEHAAQTLAHQLLENPEQLDYLDTFKHLLIGDGEREKRVIHGRRPQPTRDILRDSNGSRERWAFTIPVCAGFSIEGNERSAIVILRDPWHDHHDPNDWLVGEIDLDSGKYVEHVVTAVRNSSKEVALQVADPQRYYNMPPGMRPGPDQPFRDWQRISFEIGPDGLATEAMMHTGTEESRSFYDVEHLQRAIQEQEKYRQEQRVRQSAFGVVVQELANRDSMTLAA